MTARYLMMLALTLGVGGFAVGCSGDGKENPDVGDDDDDDAGDDDDDDETAPTGTPGSPYFDADSIFLAAQFGYNGSTSSAVAVDFGDGTPYEPGIEIILATANWSFDAADQANYCIIILPLTNSSTAPAAIADPRLFWGAQYNTAEAPLTNCNTPGYELDPNLWGDDVVGLFAVGYYGDYGDAWFAAVGTPTTDVDDVLGNYPDIVDFYIGGAIGIPAFLPSNDTPAGQVNDVYGFVYETDGNMVLAEDNGYLVNIERDSVILPGNIATGWYSMDYLGGWGFQ